MGSRDPSRGRKILNVRKTVKREEGGGDPRTWRGPRLGPEEASRPGLMGALWARQWNSPRAGSPLLDALEATGLGLHFLVVEAEHFPFFPSGFFGWFNNEINIRQINRRKINVITSTRESHRSVRLQGSQATEAHMSS